MRPKLRRPRAHSLGANAPGVTAANNTHMAAPPLPKFDDSALSAYEREMDRLDAAVQERI